MGIFVKTDIQYILCQILPIYRLLIRYYMFTVYALRDTENSTQVTLDGSHK